MLPLKRALTLFEGSTYGRYKASISPLDPDRLVEILARASEVASSTGRSVEAGR